MRLNFTGVGAAAVLALAFAVPAGAHPGNPNHPGGPGDSGTTAPSQSHKCKSHNVAYVESGAVDAGTASTLAQNSDGTWSGTLVVDVVNANHWAKSDKGKTVTYTFTNAKLRVKFDGGATGFSAGERVHLIGKLAAVAKRCTAPDTAPSPLFRMIVVHPAKS